jgi:hypothetical protein
MAISNPKGKDSRLHDILKVTVGLRLLSAPKHSKEPQSGQYGRPDLLNAEGNGRSQLLTAVCRLPERRPNLHLSGQTPKALQGKTIDNNRRCRD